MAKKIPSVPEIRANVEKSKSKLTPEQYEAFKRTGERILKEEHGVNVDFG